MPRVPGGPTFGHYITQVAKKAASTPDWRDGQRAFNVLCEVRPDLAEAIRTTPLDPFHQDERLPDFYNYIGKVWDL